MKKLPMLAVVATSVVAITGAQAQVSIVPNTAFSGDGWLSPAENAFLDTAASPAARGIAYNPVTQNLLLVSRVGGNNVRVINQSGTDLGGLNLTGVGGAGSGTFQVNMVGVGGDGAIYVANLASPLSATTPFRVYRWANEGATASIAFNSTNVTGGRLGDTFDVIGSGTSTLLVAGEANTAGSGNRNGYVVMSTADGANFSGSLVTFPVAPAPGGTAGGDFRLGITFAAANEVIGSQGGGLVRGTSFSGTTGTLLGSSSWTTTSQRPMDFTTLGGLDLLAAVDTVDHKVRIYDASNPGSLSFLVSQSGTAPSANGNSQGVGSVAWGEASYDGITGLWSQELYTLSAANGIQSFIVTVPEPSVFGLAAMGFGLLGLRLMRRNGRA